MMDTFRYCLRIAIWSFLGLILLLGLWAFVWTQISQWQVRRGYRPWDWESDGECDRDDDFEWHQRTHVHILDTVPPEWIKKWQ